jgi:hypothetical protein
MTARNQIRTDENVLYGPETLIVTNYENYNVTYLFSFHAPTSRAASGCTCF